MWHQEAVYQAFRQFQNCKHICCTTEVCQCLLLPSKRRHCTFLENQWLFLKRPAAAWGVSSLLLHGMVPSMSGNDTAASRSSSLHPLRSHGAGTVSQCNHQCLMFNCSLLDTDEGRTAVHLQIIPPGKENRRKHRPGWCTWCFKRHLTWAISCYRLKQ